MTKPNTRIILLFATVASLFGSAKAQYSVEHLVERVKEFQVTDDDFYAAGMFPAQREWFFLSKPVEDNSLFFTASIISTLQGIREDFSESNQRAVDQIIANTHFLYANYQSRNGEVTYNFWPTIPPDLPFPNGSKLISNERLRLPDDFDITVLAALAQGSNDTNDSLIRNKMNRYAGRADRGEVQLITVDEYQDKLAYEVWFGKNMPQTFDICVMSNVMYYVLDRGFDLNRYDTATIDLIQKMISNNDHFERISDISHQSNSTALVLYHVARVMAIDKEGLFDSIKPKVIEDLTSLLGEVDNEVETVMLLTSLHRLGAQVNQEIDGHKFEEDAKTFEFFAFDPSSLGMSSIFPTFRWTCEAYNWTLLLELAVLRDN